MREGLSGIACLPKKEVARLAVAGGSPRYVAGSLSAPSARDRGLAGVPFASSRLPSWSGRAGSALTHTASAQNADPNDLPLLLRDSEDWRSEAAGENDREPEPPHGKRA